VRDAALALEVREVLHVPVVVADERLLVRELRREADLLAGLVDRDERVGARGLVDPHVERREMELLEEAQRPDDGLCGQSDDLLAEARAVEDRLVVLAHGRVFGGADVEDVVDRRRVEREAAPDGAAEVLDVHELVAVGAVADHREIVAVVRPVVEEGEDAEALRSDEGLGADHGDAEALPAELRDEVRLDLDLALAVGADAVEFVRLEERVVVRDAVDGGGGDVDAAPHAEVDARLEDVAGAVDIRTADLRLGVERQRRGAVDDHVVALHRLDERRHVADVVAEDPHARVVLLRVVELRDVVARDLLRAVREEVPYEVDAEESGAAGDEDLHGGKGQGSGVVENAVHSTWNPLRTQGAAPFAEFGLPVSRRACYPLSP